jgi:4-amino-4-deoxy-L-arabinose transferase-like glycosyltransferase
MMLPELSRRVAAYLVLALFLLGLWLRATAALALGPHIDEAESILAARHLATEGTLVLPSGLLFLQGATLSVLLQAVLPWLDDPFDRLGMRSVSVLAGSAAVLAMYALARRLGSPRWMSVLASAGVALDAASIQWSAHARPYALLQLASIGLLALWRRALDRPAPLALAALSLCFALGVYTHVGVALLVPPMLWLTYERAGWHTPLWKAFATFPAAPLSLLWLNHRFGATTRGTVAGPSFIGDHVLDIDRILRPQLDAWGALFQHSATRDLLPPLVAASLAALLFRRLLVPGRGRFDRAALCALYAFPVAAVAFLTSDTQSRYLLHVHPLTYLVLGHGIAELCAVTGSRAERWTARALAAGTLAAVLGHLFDGAYLRVRRAIVHPDYQHAAAFVSVRRQAGEPVIAAMTPPVWTSPLGTEGLWFLAGPEGSSRIARYARLRPDGSWGDYWVGVPAITSVGQFCTLAASSPGAWVIVDDERLAAHWAFQGAMARAITGSGSLELDAAGGERVYRVKPRAEWSSAAVEACTAPIQQANQ